MDIIWHDYYRWEALFAMCEMASDLFPSTTIWWFFFNLIFFSLMNFTSHFCPSLFGNILPIKKKAAEHCWRCFKTKSGLLSSNQTFFGLIITANCIEAPQKGEGTKCQCGCEFTLTIFNKAWQTWLALPIDNMLYIYLLCPHSKHQKKSVSIYTV